jgi:plastocyanin
MRTTILIAAVLVAGCSSTTDGTTQTDAGAKSDTGANPAFAQCSDAELDADDHTAAGADVSFPASAAPAQYTPHCVRIKAGQTVTFTGSFPAHPLANDGETVTPIPAHATTGSEVKVSFPAAGTFGFHCDFHPTSMFGSVKVVP